MDKVTLFHGTTAQSAEALMRDGWKPSSAPVGGNCGQARYLYLSTVYEDALWFAQEKGDDTVLVLHDIPLDHLIVDPEDGCSETLEEELSGKQGLPGKVALVEPLPADCFSLAPPHQMVKTPAP